jgi:5-methyltetrahydropteroyltriglutamate--homocysteine methyltransferase
LTYDRTALDRDIANFQAALSRHDGIEGFLPVVAPASAYWLQNEYYPSEEEFVFALADALHEEYKAIVDAGLLLQVDDPRLVTYYIMQPDASIEDCRRWARPRVEALNHALHGIPRDRVRFHTCYSINIGPRLHDMQLKDMIDVMLRVNAGAFSFEAANPRHEHEWKLWKEVEVPDNIVLIPGVITNSNVMIEHPDVVADRLERFCSAVGRERVIAGADCGFASFAGSREMDETIVWHKLRALAEGARIASQRLW